MQHMYRFEADGEGGGRVLFSRGYVFMSQETKLTVSRYLTLVRNVVPSRLHYDLPMSNAGNSVSAYFTKEFCWDSLLYKKYSLLLF